VANCLICKQVINRNEESAEMFSGSVHVQCFAPYVDEKKLKILINVRCYAIGDTVAVTPVIRELRRIYPNATIDVITVYPDLFKYNTNVNKIFDRNKVEPSVIVDDYVIILDPFDSTKQLQCVTHSVEYSSKSALEKSLRISDWWLEVNYSRENRTKAKEIANISNNDNIILIHPHRTEWDTRNWGVELMAPLVAKLKEGYPHHRIISIGGKRKDTPYVLDNYVGIDGVENLYGKLSLLETVALLDVPQIKLLVTPDTGTLHLGATARELPIVGIFTLIHPEYRTPVRKNVFGYKFKGVSQEGCNCTYDSKSLVFDNKLKNCPKKTFLDNSYSAALPVETKITGLKNYDSSINWDEKILKRQIAKELNRFQESFLPCFPTVDKVFSACVELLGKPKKTKNIAAPKILELNDVTLAACAFNSENYLKLVYEAYCTFEGWLKPYEFIFFHNIPIDLNKYPKLKKARLIHFEIENFKNYSKFIIKDLHKHYTTKHCMIFQYDGFPLNPDAWDNSFLDFDYIGAKWWYPDRNVGNGGFSLRSRKMSEAAAEIILDEECHPEDDTICRKYGKTLSALNFKFAPDDIADKFSVEYASSYKSQFGFHSAHQAQIISQILEKKCSNEKLFNFLKTIS
jgi:ADP-heptose:LPS heptosyltransferase